MADSSIDGSGSSSSSSSDDSDSDFKISDTEECVPKRKRGRPKKQREDTAEDGNAINENEQKTNAVGNTEIDPNAPSKKRKYKKRAVKEKQTYECEICHYKCAHQCAYAINRNLIKKCTIENINIFQVI